MKAGDKLRFNIRLSQVPEYHPEPEPNPICTHSPDCQGCPYPRHGFLCWGSDGSCLRSKMNEIIGTEGTNYDAGNSQ